MRAAAPPAPRAAGAGGWASVFGEEADRLVDAAGEKPGLGRVEDHVHDALGAVAAVGVEALERDDEGVLHQVRVDGAVEDVDHAVLAAGGEERQPAVVGHGAEARAVVAHRPVRLRRQVHVEPAPARARRGRGAGGGVGQSRDERIPPPPHTHTHTAPGSPEAVVATEMVGASRSHEAQPA